MSIKANLPAELPETADLRRIRKSAGISATELAAHLGVSATSINSWEAGKHEPRGDLRTRYSQALLELANQIGSDVEHA